MKSHLFGDCLVAGVSGAGVDPGLVASDGVQVQAGHLTLPLLQYSTVQYSTVQYSTVVPASR